MQYLAGKAPEIPALRPHGLIQFGPFCVMFMTYIPSMTLKGAWPKLSHEGKLSVQNQLNNIFKNLRSLRKDDCIYIPTGDSNEETEDYTHNKIPVATASK